MKLIINQITFIIAFLLFLFQNSLFSQVGIDYYFQNKNFLEHIPTPKSIIGHQIGKWHISHDKLVYYMNELAKSSPRAQIIYKGKTHEDRPLIALIISSEDNIKNIENIKKRHQDFDQSGPVFIWQGYSIHGDEPSGSNAAMLYAYYLLANNSSSHKKLLENSVIILYPSFNPDGLNRFASWVNSHKNSNLTANSSDREYNEIWPTGRTNHYWFDLNRDWLPITQPESKAKIELFHEYMPNILTDHHEMGTNKTFFFQPGIPSRTHPLTPKINQQLTESIGEFHAKELDKIGSLYYSKENFDDYYYGKGSTFPDIQGCVGILFEQASSRGHYQNSDNGILTFPFTIKNQLLTSISTLKAGVNLRENLLEYQKSFYESKNKGGIEIGTIKDKPRLFELSQILEYHQIKYQVKNKSKLIDGTVVDQYIVIPYYQKKGLLAKALFDSRTTFEDSLFYDVSAFNFAEAFNLPYNRIKNNFIIHKYDSLEFPVGIIKNLNADYGYLLNWDSYYSPRALYRILKDKIRVKVANEPFSIKGKQFDRGTLFIPLQDQNKIQIKEVMKKIAQKDGVNIIGVNSGYGETKHLGSPSFEILKLPKIALAVGNGVKSTNAGEIWHLLDVKYQISITKIDINKLQYSDLEMFNIIILPDGNYNLTDNQVKKIKDWISLGGMLIGLENANEFLHRVKLSKSVWNNIDNDDNGMISYSNISKYIGARITGGAIIRTQIDKSHPIYYGYNRSAIPMFKRGNNWLENDKSSFKNVSIYDNKILLNGYLHKKNIEALKGKVNLQVTKFKRGRVISFVDNPVFRAFWLGTDKILGNMIFFGSIIDFQSCL